MGAAGGSTVMENTGFTEAGCPYGRSSVPWPNWSSSLIVERVKAGLRNARTKGKRLGRAAQDSGHEKNCRSARARSRVEAYRPAEMGVGVGTIYRVTLEGSKTREKDSGTAA